MSRPPKFSPEVQERAVRIVLECQTEHDSQWAAIPEVMTQFIDLHRHCFGVEPICAVLPIAPSTHYTHAARSADPTLLTPCPRVLVNRQFKANRPNELWVSDYTYVSSWQGFAYVAFIIDMYAHCTNQWAAEALRQAAVY